MLVKNWGYGMDNIPKITELTPEQAAWKFSQNHVANGYMFDALVKNGLLATTSGSWNSARNSDWSLLRDRDVRIWRDANNVGLKYAEHVTEILLKLGCSVKWIDIEKLNPPEGGDCVDWLID